MIDSGQVHLWENGDESRLAEANKGKLLSISHQVQTGASIHRNVFPIYGPPAKMGSSTFHAVGQTYLREGKHVTYYLT